MGKYKIKSADNFEINNRKLELKEELPRPKKYLIKLRNIFQQYESGNEKDVGKVSCAKCCETKRDRVRIEDWFKMWVQR